MTKKTWSAYQTAIFNNVEHGRGHSVVLARAGSGKTTTIVEALKYVDPHDETLMVAFNKSIATELAARVPRGVEVQTLHGYGFRAVQNALGKMRVEPNKVLGLIDETYGTDELVFERKRLISKVVSLSKSFLVGYQEDRAQSLARIDGIFDMASLSLSAPTEPKDRTRVCEQVFEILMKCREPGKCVDFDDMVWLPVMLDLKTWKYDRVFIDETQDLNPTQIELALRAVKKSGRIVAVGDDKQAIYAFRGADTQAIPNIVARLNAKVMPLSVTYRCARSIVAEAKKLVPDLEWAEGAADGELYRDTSEEWMKRAAGPGDFILSRTNAPLIRLCLGFLREGRKANIQGRDVGTNLLAHVKRARGKTIAQFLDQVDDWRTSEVIRLESKNRSTDVVTDTADMLEALCDGAVSISEVEARIESLFADGDDTSRIILSSTHKAKGLERDRVFLLRDTYLKKDADEEQNLYYVAVTRAKNTLHLVTKVGVEMGTRDEPPAVNMQVARVHDDTAPVEAPQEPEVLKKRRAGRGMGAMRRAVKGDE